MIPPVVVEPAFAVVTVPSGVVAMRSALAPGVVSFRASLPVETAAGSADDLALALAVRLLDKGTTARSRHDIAEWLDARGASLSFSSHGDRVGISGRALRGDLAGVLALAAEQLAGPLFDAAEVDKARARLLASVKSAEDDPGAHADGLLHRALFPPAHPGYSRTFAGTSAILADLTRADVVRTQALGLADAPVTLALGGDVAGLDLAALTAPFGVRARAVPDPDVPAPLDGPSAGDAAMRLSSVVPGTASADVRLGHALTLRRGDADYLALRVAVFALGGNFSSRLMQTVRDRDGLTYGIHAHLDGIDARHGGHVEVGVTLSPEHLERGIETTRREVEGFAREGVAAADVARVTATLGGQQRVGLSTSGGAAAAQLSALEQRLGADYPDRFAALAAALTADEVNAALARHLDPSRLVTTLAGPVGAISSGQASSGVQGGVSPS